MTDPSDRTRAFQPTITGVCPDCHSPVLYNHDVYCPGPAQRVADPIQYVEPECDCDGAWHERGCPIAYWPEPA